MSRAFLDTNGAPSYTKVVVEAPAEKAPESLPEKAAKVGSFAEQVKERYERPSGLQSEGAGRDV